MNKKTPPKKIPWKNPPDKIPLEKFLRKIAPLQKFSRKIFPEEIIPQEKNASGKSHYILHCFRSVFSIF